MVQKSGYPVEFGSLSQYLQLFFYIPGGWPWDFWSIKSMNQGEHPFVFTAKTPSFLFFLWHGWGGFDARWKTPSTKNHPKTPQTGPKVKTLRPGDGSWPQTILKKKTVKSTPIRGVIWIPSTQYPWICCFFGDVLRILPWDSSPCFHHHLGNICYFCPTTEQANLRIRGLGLYQLFCKNLLGSSPR